MCCYSRENSSKVIKEDLTVYKVYIQRPFFDNPNIINTDTNYIYLSPFYGGTIYKSGKIYCSDGFEYKVEPVVRYFASEVEKAFGPNKICYGFHSFKNKSDAIALAELLEKTIVNERKDDKFVVMVCTIPSGTNIYEGNSYFGDSLGLTPESYVSEKIIINSLA
jgi:hypothetical protein